MMDGDDDVGDDVISGRGGADDVNQRFPRRFRAEEHETKVRLVRGPGPEIGGGSDKHFPPVVQAVRAELLGRIGRRGVGDDPGFQLCLHEAVEFGPFPGHFLDSAVEKGFFDSAEKFTDIAKAGHEIEKQFSRPEFVLLPTADEETDTVRPVTFSGGVKIC
ncbi:MAG: hypothetical protein LIQ31_09065 [Planctomycetes bacterium]|nr:hypothetical protein [Planctomycetota bacterium]